MAGELPLAVVQLHDEAAIIPMEAMREIVIQDLGLRSFPMTTSGKFRKGDLKRQVAGYIHGTRQQEDPKHDIKEDKLAGIFASVLGQSPTSLL